MFELGFGIFWSLMTLIMTIAFARSAEEMQFSLIIFLGLFWLVGISLLVKGLKKIITDNKTEKLGEECYGQIKNIYPNGCYVNNAPEFNADFLIYIQSKNSMERITEKIGFDPNKYQVNSFIKGKYYNGDINIKEVVDYNLIPLNIRPNFDHLISAETNVSGADIITVNGVRYKRIDNEQNTDNQY